MKRLLFIFILLPFISFSQEGGVRSMKTSSEKVIFRDLSGINDGIVGINNNGVSKRISVDGTTVILSNGILSASSTDVTSTLTSGWTVKWDSTKLINWYNPALQTLSGTSPSWNAANGTEAEITISGNTTISLSGITANTSGTLYITNPSTVYKLKIVGYTLDISNNLTVDSGGITLSGNSKYDKITWRYNGSILSINGHYNYTRITF